MTLLDLRSPVPVDVTGDLGVALVYKATVIVQRLFRKSSRVNEVTMGRGELTGAEPVPCQSSLLGNAPWNWPIVVPANGPGLHLRGNCDVMNRAIVARGDACGRKYVIAYAQPELDRAEHHRVSDPRSSHLDARLGSFRMPNGIASLTTKQDPAR